MDLNYIVFVVDFLFSYYNDKLQNGFDFLVDIFHLTSFLLGTCHVQCNWIQTNSLFRPKGTKSIHQTQIHQDCLQRP